MATRSLIVLLVVASFGGLTQAQARVKRVISSFHVGSAHPLGIFDSLSDANIHVDVDLSYRIPKHVPSGVAWYAKLLVGLNQFTAESFTGIAHPRWINASLNAQVVSSGTYVQAGGGVYWPKSGSSRPGVNIGVGRQIPVGGIRLEFGLDLHQVQSKPVTRFVTIQLGVLY
jgi:hypothetical protein